MIALEFLPELEEEAKARKGKAGVPVAERRRTRAKTSRKSTEDAAALTGAKPRSVQAAKRVEKHAPELLPRGRGFGTYV